MLPLRINFLSVLLTRLDAKYIQLDIALICFTLVLQELVSAIWAEGPDLRRLGGGARLDPYQVVHISNSFGDFSRFLSYEGGVLSTSQT